MNYDRFIVVSIGLSPVILKVMSINTFGFIMLGQIERTPLGLIIEHVEIVILSIVMDKSG